MEHERKSGACFPALIIHPSTTLTDLGWLRGIWKRFHRNGEVFAISLHSFDTLHNTLGMLDGLRRGLWSVGRHILKMFRSVSNDKRRAGERKSRPRRANSRRISILLGFPLCPSTSVSFRVTSSTANRTSALTGTETISFVFSSRASTCTALFVHRHKVGRISGTRRGTSRKVDQLTEKSSSRPRLLVSIAG